MEFDVINILYYCAVILLSTKLLGIITRKMGLPQVVGFAFRGVRAGTCSLAPLFSVSSAGDGFTALSHRHRKK